jgi:hypothetical protein
MFMLISCQLTCSTTSCYSTCLWSLEYDLYLLNIFGYVYIYCLCRKFDICNHEMICMGYFFEFYFYWKGSDMFILFYHIASFNANIIIM